MPTSHIDENSLALEIWDRLHWNESSETLRKLADYWPQKRKAFEWTRSKAYWELNFNRPIWKKVLLDYRTATPWVLAVLPTSAGLLAVEYICRKDENTTS